MCLTALQLCVHRPHHHTMLHHLAYYFTDYFTGSQSHQLEQHLKAAQMRMLTQQQQTRHVTCMFASATNSWRAGKHITTQQWHKLSSSSNMTPPAVCRWSVVVEAKSRQPLCVLCFSLQLPGTHLLVQLFGGVDEVRCVLLDLGGHKQQQVCKQGRKVGTQLLR